jgi:RNA polymerase sigma factor (sigma-70 family)
MSTLSAASRDAEAIVDSLRRPERFGEIFDRHFQAVHRYLARRVGAQQADDLASSTFVIAFERRRRFRSDCATALPWLLGIATNLLHERRRAGARELDTLNRFSSDASRAAQDAAEDDSAELLAAVADALTQMDSEQRDVLLLYAWADLSYDEIAKALHVPIGTVRSRLSRARRQLRSHLPAAPDGASALPEGETEP